MKRIYSLICLLVMFAVMQINAIEFNFHGDHRVRAVRLETSSKSDMSYRMRVRLNGSASISDRAKFQMGLISKGSNASSRQSNSQTLDHFFSSQSLNLDYAFITYLISDWGQWRVGKQKNALFCPSELAWDSDIRPEGISFQTTKTVLSDNMGVDLNAGLFVVNDYSNSISDPIIGVVQPKMTLSLYDRYLMTTALGVYGSSNLTGKQYGRHDINSEYYPIVYSIQLDRMNDVYPHMRVVSELIYNFNAASQNKAALVGMQLGAQTVEAAGQWQFSANYHYLESQSWFPLLTNSDAMSGQLGVSGWSWMMTIGLTPFISFDADVYRMSHLDNQDREWRIQVDLNTRF